MNRFFQPALTAVLLSAALVVIFVTLLGGSIVQAASYVTINTFAPIVDPIMDIYGSPHSYSGNNLEPFANLTNANLSYAELFNADLTNANLTNADLLFADLGNADLTNANLTGAFLFNADLYYATFSTGTTLHDGQTVLQHGFDTAGLRAYLEASPVNASTAANIFLVPEPHTLLLASLASMGLTLRRRRWAR
jgi:hypothetical protein